MSAIGKCCENYMTTCDAANLVTSWVVQGGEVVAWGLITRLKVMLTSVTR